MPLRLTHLKRKFLIDNMNFAVELEVFTETSRSTLSADGVLVASDGVENGQPDPLRNHRLTWVRPDGKVLDVEVGPATTWSYGLIARLDGETVYESHPGRTLGFGPKMQRFSAWAASQNTEENKARNDAAWKRNWPSLATDLSLGLAFFLVAREFGLVQAAVAGAVAGIVLWIVQRITKIDLLGGLAVFGIAMSLISAAFALIFRDDAIIQHRGTILGVLGALPFLADGLFANGQRLAVRLARYLTFAIDARRLGIGMGVIGLVSAGLNALAVALLSQDQWLVFTTFVDTPITILIFLATLLWVRKGPDARHY